MTTVIAPTTQDPFGGKLRGYEIWGRIGEGGMSEVWLAKHRGLCVPVIIKSIRHAVLESIGADRAGERLLMEARLMARVTNPRVVRAIDAGVSDAGVPFLVQEYVDGVDLAELDGRRRAILGVGLPLWFVCYAMQEICEALHAAHQAGVLHRDVKPSNVFGAPETGIRLGDFGIAVAQTEEGQKETSGTIKFMAPEQFRGELLDRTTDVYGAGATACDLRYGHAPFRFMDQVLDAASGPELPTPKSAEEAFFQHMLREMLSKDRAARPQTAAEAGRHFGSLARALTPSIAAGQMLGRSSLRIGQTMISTHVGDVASAEADAIVCSANYQMTMRAGVGESIRLRGGDSIETEAVAHGEQPLGSCVRTGAGTLAAKHVIHAVSAWNEVSCVGRAMARALIMCDEFGCKTVAMPALGTGAGRVSMEMSTNAMMTALRWHSMLGGSRVSELRVYLGDERKRKIFQEVAEEAIRGTGAGARFKPDLGLEATGEVRAEASTYLDPSNPDLTRSQ